MKRIIGKILLAMTIVAVCGNVYAQKKKEVQRFRREQWAAVQAKHIANRLALDDATTEKFVKAFCEYQQELWAVVPKDGKGNKSYKMTDAEAEKSIKDAFDQSQKRLDIKRKYYDVYRKFLSPKQIKRVYEMDRNVMNRLSGNLRIANWTIFDADSLHIKGDSLRIKIYGFDQWEGIEYNLSKLDTLMKGKMYKFSQLDTLKKGKISKQIMIYKKRDSK